MELRRSDTLALVLLGTIAGLLIATIGVWGDPARPESLADPCRSRITTQGNYLLYETWEIGLRLVIPNRWRVAGDTCDGESLILVSSEVDGRSERERNKIDIFATDNEIAEQGVGSEDPLGPVRLTDVERRVTVGGKIAVRTDVELDGGIKYRSYRVPLSQHGRFLYFTIFGDPEGFDQLDQILETIQWTRING